VPNALHLADLTTDELRALLDRPSPCAALVPVGSVEPHGPHLPLATDTVISAAAAERAAASLREKGVTALVAPPVGYGVTRFAEGFAGAVSVPASALSAFLRAIVDGLLEAGFAHVSLVNSHLEPDHDAAVRSALEGIAEGRASVASPLTRRWARTLSPEFKSGACHAGRYETSIVLFASPASVDMDLARGLPDVSISLSEGIQAGQASFRAMGIERAYTGSPREASAEEGSELLDRLAAMIAAEVEEGLAARTEASR
jgi:creatinine amidohydrolase